MLTAISNYFFPKCIKMKLTTMLNVRRWLTMGKDRQEKKLRESGRVESDRDVGLRYKGSTKMSSPEEARRLNDGKK